MNRLGWLIGWLAFLAGPTMAAKFDWSAFEQYRPEYRLLHFHAEGADTAGTLLVWPELSQPHLWLAMAEYWQQRGWDFMLLLPDASQLSFDPSSEQPPPQQQEWLEQASVRLAGALAETESDPLLLVVAQGSAALWYQQLIDAEQLMPPDALVLLDAHPQTPGQQQMLAISLARSRYPVLDIYSQPEEAQTTLNRQRRRQQVARQAKTDYEEQRLTAHTLLEKQIAGWLMRQGWLPPPPGLPDYLKGKIHEAGISRPTDPGAGN
ncbi:DUF3530 family protein [Zobellella iuensis]|uniref:DUF3530 family protein n=1 Tax=Zobellella iuensis TaxID=2803811 RepID=A0ABS1QMG7_9GAMM|nr:DUF3530 family protein [Zobellella iuensis]